jgi:chromosome condensin MukBEF complex kleisin-like MukF subunit
MPAVLSLAKTWLPADEFTRVAGAGEEGEDMARWNQKAAARLRFSPRGQAR